MLRNRFPQIIAQLPARMDGVERAGAEMIHARAQIRAPVGEPPEDKHPGRLRDSLHVERSEMGSAVVADATDDKGFPYAYVIEFGGHTEQHGYGPRAFLIPSLEESRDEVMRLALATLKTL